MLNRIIIDPLALTPETERILSNYLLGVSNECRISHRHRHYRYGQPVFWLSHDIVVRQKSHGIWRYYVVDLNEVGSGRNGATFRIVGRLHFNIIRPDQLIVKRYSIEEESRLYKKQKFLADREHQNMSRLPGLFTREYLPGYPNFISMRYFKGTDISKMIENDFNLVHPLTKNMRYRISLALLRALQDQVTDWMVLHRDIKPNNLIYNTVTHEAIIIDLGSSQIRGHYLDKRSGGNSRYSAPEVYTSKEHGRPITFDECYAHSPTVNNSSVKSEIYSMALVISLLWRNQDPLLIDECGGGKRRILLRANSGWRRAMHLFTGIEDDLSKDEAQLITQQLESMIQVSPDSRPDLQQCIRFFDSMYLEDKLRDFDGDRDQLRYAHKVGIDCYNAMRHVRRSEALYREMLLIMPAIGASRTISLKDFMARLNKKYLYKYSELHCHLSIYINDYNVPDGDTLSNFLQYLKNTGSDINLQKCISSNAMCIADNEYCIAEFIEAADIKCLNGTVKSKDDLLLQLRTIFDDFALHYHAISVKYAEIKQDLQDEKQSQHHDADRLRVLSALVMDLDYFFKNIQGKPMTVDWICRIKEHCFKKYAKTDMALQEMMTYQQQQSDLRL